MVIPVTSNIAHLYPSEAIVTIDGKQSKAMSDQVMAADKSRLMNRVSALSQSDMAKLEDAILLHFGLLR